MKSVESGRFLPSIGNCNQNRKTSTFCTILCFFVPCTRVFDKSCLLGYTNGLSKRNAVTFLTHCCSIISCIFSRQDSRSNIIRYSSCYYTYAIKIRIFQLELYILYKNYTCVSPLHKQTLNLECSSFLVDFLWIQLRK